MVAQDFVTTANAMIDDPERSRTGGTGRAEIALPDLRGKKILIVEDDPVSRLTLEEALLPTGATLNNSECGEDVIARPDSDDLILMDIHLPGISGLETARKLRRGGVTTPIITCSGVVVTLRQEWLQSSGIDGHLAKPVDRALLYRLLETFL